MNPMEIAGWDVADVFNVVYVPSHGDAEFVCMNGHNIKSFNNRRYHGLVLKIDGKCIYSIDQKYSVTSSSGSLVYLPMGKPYTVESVEEGTCFCVNFYIRQETNLPCFAFSVRNYHKWYSLFTNLLHTWNYQQPGYRARVFSILYEMFASVAEDCSAQYLPTRQKNAIARLVEHLGSESFSQSVADLARQCDMSETYFRKIFHSIYGTSPKQYILDARFRQAKALLSTTDTPIAEIANLCGFENTYSFSRAFHNREGNSPSEYRQNNRE